MRRRRVGRDRGGHVGVDGERVTELGLEARGVGGHDRHRAVPTPWAATGSAPCWVDGHAGGIRGERVGDRLSLRILGSDLLRVGRCRRWPTFVGCVVITGG